MKKTPLLLSLLSVVALGAVSCAQQDNPASSEASTSEAQESHEPASESQAPVAYSVTLSFGELKEAVELSLGEGSVLDLSEYSYSLPGYECLDWKDGNKIYAPKEKITVTGSLNLVGEFVKADSEFVLNNEKDGYIALRYVGEDKEKAEIPSTFHGLPVKRVAASYFGENANIKEVVIPTSVEMIGGGVLAGLANVQSIIVPFLGANIEDAESTIGYLFGVSSINQSVLITKTLSSVTLTKQEILPKDAFSYMDQLTEVKLLNAKTICTGAFESMEGLTHLSLGKVLVELQENSIYGCTALEELELPNSLQTYNLAIMNCPITSLYLGSEVSTFNFRNDLTKLERIDVSSGNGFFASDEAGIVYNASGDTLLFYPRGKEAADVKIPDGITALGNCSFLGAKLNSIDLNGVASIGQEAFRYANLPSVTLPSSVISIGKTAFSAAKMNEFHFASSLEGAEELALPDFLFSSCANLKSIEVPAYVHDIGRYAFAGEGIENVDLKGEIRSIGEVAFGSSKIAELETTFCDGAFVGKRIFVNSLIGNWKVHFADGVTSYPTLEEGGFGEKIPSIICDDEATASALKQAWSGYSDFIGVPKQSPFLIVDGVLKQFVGTAEDVDVVIPEGVTRIEAGVFKNNSYVKHITLPSTLVTLGTNVFSGCANLRTVEITNEDASVLRCVNVGKDGTETATGLNSAKFGNEQTLILVKHADQVAKVKELMTPLYSRPVVASDEVKEEADALISPDGKILYREFLDSFEDYSLPEGVTKVFDDCFYGITDLTEIDLTGVEEIGYQSFSGTGLSEVVLPESVVSVATYAFDTIESLTSIKIEGAVTLAERAFTGDEYVENIDLGDKIVSIGEGAFGGLSQSADTYPESLVLPASLEFIAEDAFEDAYIQNVYCCFSQEQAEEWNFATCLEDNGANIVYDYAA